MDPIWTLLLVAACGLAAGGGAYWLATHAAARTQAAGLVTALRVLIGQYLTTVPQSDTEITRLLTDAYATLPPAVRATLPADQWAHLVVPLLLQVEHALFTPPPPGEPPHAA